MSIICMRILIILNIMKLNLIICLLAKTEGTKIHNLNKIVHINIRETVKIFPILKRITTILKKKDILLRQDIMKVIRITETLIKLTTKVLG